MMRSRYEADMFETKSLFRNSDTDTDAAVHRHSCLCVAPTVLRLLA